MDISWDLSPGDSLLRRHLHDRYGGSGQGGIAPSRTTPNVFLITDPLSGSLYGYNFDGWHEDGTFLYTGEGQIGDQRMARGNKAVLEHAPRNYALRLLRAEGTTVHYIGEFALADDPPYLIDEAPSRASEEGLRNVIIFRLRPVDDVAPRPDGVPAGPALPTVVDIEASNVEEYVIERPDESVTALRREAGLVARYAAWLARHGHQTARHRVPTPGGRSMFTDLFDIDAAEVVEAKASASRSHVRMALGQVLDYGRYVEHRRLAVLLPSEPERDLRDLLTDHGVGCVWERKANDFDRADPTHGDG